MFLATLAIGIQSPRVSAQENPNQAEQRRLFREGAKLWPVYCNTCHNARPGSEKAPYEWDQIMMHNAEARKLTARRRESDIAIFEGAIGPGFQRGESKL